LIYDLRFFPFGWCSATDQNSFFLLGEFLSESEPRCTLQSLSRYEAGKGFPLPSLSQSIVLQCYLSSAEQIAIARILRAIIKIVFTVCVSLLFVDLIKNKPISGWKGNTNLMCL
jgi:hypothetical protein